MSQCTPTRVESILQSVSPDRREFFRTLLSGAALGAAALVPLSEVVAENEGDGAEGKGKGKGEGKGNGAAKGKGGAADGAAKGKGGGKGKGKGKGKGEGGGGQEQPSGNVGKCKNAAGPGAP